MTTPILREICHPDAGTWHSLPVMFSDHEKIVTIPDIKPNGPIGSDVAHSVVCVSVCLSVCLCVCGDWLMCIQNHALDVVHVPRSTFEDI